MGLEDKYDVRIEVLHHEKGKYDFFVFPLNNKTIQKISSRIDAEEIFNNFVEYHKKVGGKILFSHDCGPITHSLSIFTDMHNRLCDIESILKKDYRINF